MSSRDPWSHIPNLSGVKAPDLEDTRAIDPSRFFPSARDGAVDAVTGRILDVPCCAVSLGPYIPLAGPVSNAVPTRSGDPIYDNDGMTAESISYIKCITPGLYTTGLTFIASGGGVSPISWSFRTGVNGNPNAYTCIDSGTGPTPGWAEAHSPSGPWFAKAGDKLACYIDISASVNLTNIIMWATLSRTFGSDN